jgi:diguanylate cyclase (GGDEF)-like protein
MQTHILGLVTPLMALFFAATFLALWRAGRMERYVLGFALAYILFPAGFLVTHLLPTEAFYTFHTTQVFYTLATVFLMGSICERAGRRLHWPTLLVIYLVSAGALAAAMTVSNDVGPRVIIVNIGYGVITMMALTMLLTTKKRGMIDLAIIGLMAVGAADFLVRPVLTLLYERSIPAEVYRDSIYYSLIGLVLGLKAATTALVLIGATVMDLTTALRESGARDPLTGLHNRGSFETSMGKLLARSQAGGQPLSLVVADIDHFKQVNDIWGHQAGDMAIAGFGELIGETVRSCDTAGRIGGEEFCIAVWNCDNAAAERLAERIRLAFARREQQGLGRDVRLTASFGIATAKSSDSYERLFARADAALYRAKADGRNRVENAGRPSGKGGEKRAPKDQPELQRAAG